MDVYPFLSKRKFRVRVVKKWEFPRGARNKVPWHFTFLKTDICPLYQGPEEKCVKALNLLKVVSNTDWGGDRRVLLQLYRVVVRSKLDYGCFICGAACKSYISLLDPIQNQGLRLSLGARTTT